MVPGASSQLLAELLPGVNNVTADRDFRTLYSRMLNQGTQHNSHLIYESNGRHKVQETSTTCTGNGDWRGGSQIIGRASPRSELCHSRPGFQNLLLLFRMDAEPRNIPEDSGGTGSMHSGFTWYLNTQLTQIHELETRPHCHGNRCSSRLMEASAGVYSQEVIVQLAMKVGLGGCMISVMGFEVYQCHMQWVILTRVQGTQSIVANYLMVLPGLGTGKLCRHSFGHNRLSPNAPAMLE